MTAPSFGPHELEHIELGAGFRRLTNPSVQEADLVIAWGAKDLILEANRLAGEHAVKLVLNQTMRVTGNPVTGAVCPQQPAHST